VPREVDNGYTTPQVFAFEGQEALLSWGAEHLTVHTADTGKLLWSCGGFNPAATPLWPAVASPVLSGNVAVVCFGRADKGAPRLHGVRIQGRGEAGSEAHLWKREDVSSFVPSPAAIEGRVYVLGDRGLLACVHPGTGQPQWTAELPKASSNYYATPLLAGGLLYAAREDGAVYVGKIGAKFELVSENRVDDRIIAGLVPVGNRVLVRGMNSLFCFGK
jgi:outer membrane protein assembly factor BamB